MIGKPQAFVIGGAVASLAVVVLLLGLAEGSPPNNGRPVIVCVDSTVSTDGVRASYRPDLKTVIRRAALHQARFYAASCGANATGSVDWPIHRTFTSSFGGDLAREQADHQVNVTVKGSKHSEGLDELLATSSKQPGTPLGEMLAVVARQCEQVGGNCSIYLFTDGEWAGKHLKVSDGVSETERRDYLKTYVPQLTDLSGSQVNFVGVGYGTSMGEVRLGEAREIAAELVQGAGGEMGIWTTRL